ncbi:MAG: hypothetical protein HY686_05765 [Chloroflexi bacterium]|nr:hypothetical protein [Chloroflexota bacterium]
MSRWTRPTVAWAALLLALLLGMAPLGSARAQGPSGSEPVKIRVMVNDGGFNGVPGDYTVEVEQGKLVELTFVWAHEAYPQEEHIMVIDGYDLEWDLIDSSHREATAKFIADKPGTFNFFCDKKCDLHRSLQRGYLKVTRGGGASKAVVATSATPTPAAASTVSKDSPTDPPAAPKDLSGTVEQTQRGDSVQSSGPARVQAPSDSEPVKPPPEVVVIPTTLKLSATPKVAKGETIALMASPKDVREMAKAQTSGLSRQTFTLMTTLQDQKGSPVRKAEVRFFVDVEFAGEKGKMLVGTAKTDANGVALLDYQATVAAPTQTITAQFEGMGLYDESTQTVEAQEEGVPPPAYPTAPIGLEGIRHWAPRALIMVILGVWATFAFILYQAFGMSRARAGK